MSPTLPPELWRKILRLSVEIPGILETKWDHPPDLLLWQGWEDLPHPAGSASTFPTKSSIVQVSRAWHEIGIELLYESQCILGNEYSVGQRMSKLTAILERHSSPGRALKRLEISTSALTPSAFPVLMHLLNCCHNICTLVISPRRSSYSLCNASDLCHFASLLQSRFHHSLRYLDFNLNYLERTAGSSQYHYHLHLPNVPLDTLELGSNTHSTKEPPAIITVSALILYHPTSLDLDEKIISWHFPALRHLSLRGIEDRDIPLYLPFFASHGPQLFSLHFDSVRPIHGPKARLPLLIAPATNLRCLVFNTWDIESFAGDHSFPSITHIGVCLPSPRMHQDPGWTFPNNPFPNLQCIRFLDFCREPPKWAVDSARKHPHIRVEFKKNPSD